MSTVGRGLCTTPGLYAGARSVPQGLRGARDTPGVRIAYVCSRYPAVSRRFILREGLMLRRRSNEVQTVSIRRAGEEEALSEADREALETTFAVLPPRWGSLASAHLRAAVRAPRAYASTLGFALRSGPRGLRARLWQLFYFVEAVLVWTVCARRDVRHLHAPFTNVGASVGMIAARYGAARGEGPRSWSLTMHGVADVYDGGTRPVAEKLRSAELIVCVSDFLRGQAMSFVEPDHWPKLHVVRTFVDLDRFTPPQRAGAGNGTGAHVLCVARLVPIKALPLLLDAIAMTRAEGLETTATIVGAGPERAHLERQARELGLDGSVELPGAVGQDSLSGFYQPADLFCLPSFIEGLPVVLIEAMAMRLPVGATRVGGIPELVEDGTEGLLGAPGRADELAAAIARLARDPDLRVQMGEAGRRKVEMEFDVERSAPRGRAPPGGGSWPRGWCCQTGPPGTPCTPFGRSCRRSCSTSRSLASVPASPTASAPWATGEKNGGGAWTGRMAPSFSYGG